MKKSDLKAGYAVKYKTGEIRIITNSTEKGLALTSVDGVNWGSLKFYRDDLSCTTSDMYDIVEVYGYAKHPLYALTFTKDSRKLLWKRDEPKIVRVIKSNSSYFRHMEHLPEHTKVNDILTPFDWTKNEVYINGILTSYPEAQLTLGEICKRDDTDFTVRIVIVPKTKEMTVAEIEKELGYRVKIVK